MQHPVLEDLDVLTSWVSGKARRGVVGVVVNCLKMVQNRKIKITYLIVVVFFMRSGCFWSVSNDFLVLTVDPRNTQNA